MLILKGTVQPAMPGYPRDEASLSHGEQASAQAGPGRYHSGLEIRSPPPSLCTLRSETPFLF